MTKNELAQIVATNMNKINKSVDIKKTTEMLAKRMKKRELEMIASRKEA